MNDFTDTQPLWEVSYVPTAEEFYTALCSGSQRKASKTRLIIQSVLLAAVALWCVLPQFFGGTGDTMLAGVAVAVCVAMWLVPPLKMKADAKNAAAAGTAVRLRVYEQGLCFGNGEGDTAVPFSDITGYPEAAQMTLAMGDELVPVPYRAVTEECRAFIADRVARKEADHV